MRFTLRIGRLTIFDFKLFSIDEPESEDVVVVRHHYMEEEDKSEDDGPDMFGGK